MSFKSPNEAESPSDATNGHIKHENIGDLKGDGDAPSEIAESLLIIEGEVVNASGHRDQLQRGYGLLSLCGLALTVDNAWVAIGTSLKVAIYNGGPAGIIYEFLVASFYYCFIAASLAEFASSVPSAGGVYHWASITAGPRYGRVVGFYTGWINFFGWLFDLASIVYIMAELVVQMYALFHPSFVILPWHLFVTICLITWLCIAATIFLNAALPRLQQFGLFMVLVGGIITIIVVVAMPPQHASHDFVWGGFDDNNLTGWAPGVAFLTGVLNGAFTIGTPDAVTHMAEELPNPKHDLPKAMFAQISLGTIYAFCFVVAILYGINDLNAVLDSNGSFPLAAVYRQCTGGNTGATFGLLFIIFLSLVPCLIGTFLTVGRTWWALARDGATPFSKLFSRVNERLSCPIPATLFTGLMTTAFGAITLGSGTAFTDLVGSFIILTTTSYALAILPNMLTRRSVMPRGPFHMGTGVLGYIINGLAVALIVMFDVFYCFPYALPATKEGMNYNSVILAGVVALTTIWWVIGGRKYEGPKITLVHVDSGPRRLSKV